MSSLKSTRFTHHSLRLVLCYTLAIGTGWCAPAKRPNVLFFAIDDLRPELGCYGNDHIKSPNIDRLAAQGMVFDRAYCQVSVCGPSRASLLTGFRPDSKTCKIWTADQFAPNAVTLPQAFREAGYYTISNSKIFHGPEQAAERSWSETPTGHETHKDFFHPESKKFATKKRGPLFEGPDVPDNTYLDGKTCDKSIADLKRLAKMDQPFFLAVGFVRPHLPFYAPKKYWDLYDRDKIQIADNRFTPKNAPAELKGSNEAKGYNSRNIQYNSQEYHRAARHGYYACVSYVDAQVGKVLATLEELGLRDNTIIVLWGDHGWHLGEHNFWGKHNLLHNATHAPLIISAPGHKKGVRAKAIVELVDIYPTLCELAGIDVSKPLDGTSAVPLLDGADRQWKQVAITRFQDGVTATTRDFTYTEYPKQSHRMLYDLRKDPAENENVAESPEYADVVTKMSKLIADSTRKNAP